MKIYTNQYKIFFPQDNANNPNNLNTIFSDFIKIVKTAIDNYAPLVKLSRRQRKLKLKPWITRGLLILPITSLRSLTYMTFDS